MIVRTSLSIIFITLVFITGTGILSGQEKAMEQIAGLITAAEKKFAPDKRVEFWDIHLKTEAGQPVISGETTSREGLEHLMMELDKLNIRYTCTAATLPERPLLPKTYGIISLSAANIRKSPQHSAEMVTQALMGTVVRVFKKHSGWYLIQTPDGYLGWTDDDGVERMEWKQIEDYLSCARIIVTSAAATAYTQPDEHSSTVTDLVAGNILSAETRNGEWIRVRTPDGRSGNIRAADGKDFDEWLRGHSFTSELILKTAKRFMGVPYLWGGTSGKGLDCSGFTKTVYYLNGILLQRDASQQYHQGKLISTKPEYSIFKPGDLLFFGRREYDGTENATHVALYLGDGKYIHSSGRVRINSLDKESQDYNDHRFRTFLRATRILGELPLECRLSNSKYYVKTENEK